MNRTWLEARVRTDRHHTGVFESLMESQGALSITLSDDGDTPVLEPGVGETPLWDSVVVTGLFPGEISRTALRGVLRLGPGIASERQISLVEVRDKAWERAWMDGLEPLRFGQGLWVVPTGCPVPSGAATVLKLDPGLAFGTGTHPTTRLCLEFIAPLDLAGATVVDFGCGSGILGIAAALRGAARIICVDTDPQALEATLRNASRNSVADRLETELAEAYQPERGDLVLANILAETLVDLAGVLCSSLRPGGRIALSGILPGQAEKVAAAYSAVTGEWASSELDGWVLLTGARDLRGR